MPNTNKALTAFERVSFKSDEKKTLKHEVQKEGLCILNTEGHKVILPVNI